MPRTLAIGDIHGCDTALHALLDLVAPEPDDTVVILGDVVDRGPGSRQCIERLIQLRDECDAVFLQGNHEEMMLDFLGRPGAAAWLAYGGRETLDSYGGGTDDVPEEHVSFLETMLDNWVTPSTYFVHANFDAGYPLDGQPSTILRWEHLNGWEPEWPNERRIVCGHTSQKDGIPKTMPGWVCIDTCAHGGAWLTCLDVGDDLVWQANDAGVTRGPIPLDEIAQPFRRR